MTTFDEREKGFENKFAHDEQLEFKAVARRNKLVGLWAAELLNKTGDDADEYALGVVKADFEETGDEDVVRKLVADLGSRVSEKDIRVKLMEMMAVARQQLMDEK